jgi:hypothetical protein
MKRVNIQTPGKILNYKDFTGIRTPTFVDIEDNEVEIFKGLLSMHGIDKYEVVDIDPKQSVKIKRRKCKKSMKKVNLIGASSKQIKMSMT